MSTANGARALNAFVWLSLIVLTSCAVPAQGDAGLDHGSRATPGVANSGLNGQSDGTHGKSPLMVAARQGRLSEVRELLRAGADVNYANDNGGTPLMYAALGGNSDVVALLLEHGASADTTADNGWGALMVAAAKGYTDITALLLARGADPNLADVYRWTPLMRAVYEHRVGVVRLLLAHAATDVNRPAENDITALHLAATQGYADLVRILLDHGADRRLRDSAGRTPYAIALEADRHPLLELLRN